MSTTSKYELDFLEQLRQHEDGEITVKQLASIIASRLDELSKWARIMGEELDANDIEALWESFDFMSNDTSTNVEELDDALERLYDWADGPVFDEKGNLVPQMLLCRVRSTIVDS